MKSNHMPFKLLNAILLEVFCTLRQFEFSYREAQRKCTRQYFECASQKKNLKWPKNASGVFTFGEWQSGMLQDTELICAA
jgi:hypothetical protein